MKSTIIISLTCCALLSGCASKPSKPVNVPMTHFVGIEIPKLAHYPAKFPEQQLVSAAPIAVRNPEKLRIVEGDVYIDKDGNLVDPGRKYVVDTPASWNLEAIRKGNPYIPPDSTTTPYTSNEVRSTFSGVAPVRINPSPAKPQPVTPTGKLETIHNPHGYMIQGSSINTNPVVEAIPPEATTPTPVTTQSDQGLTDI